MTLISLMSWQLRLTSLAKLILVWLGAFVCSWLIQISFLSPWINARIEYLRFKIKTFSQPVRQLPVLVQKSWQRNRNLTGHLQNLELQFARASAELTELSALRQENEQLRTLVGQIDRAKKPMILAAPLFSLSTPAIAAGSNEGIKPGQLLFISQTLIGRVLTVTEHESTISLFWQKSSVPIVVQTESGVEGLLVGDGKNVLLTHVSPDAVLQIQDRLETVGQPGIPPHKYVGRIREIRATTSHPTQTAVIEQLVSFFEAKFIEVEP